jgi:hypothetical protein
MSSVGGVSLFVGAGLLATAGLSWSLADRHLTAPATWKKKRARHVIWMGDDEPSGEEAEAAREAIVGRGLSTYGDVTWHLATRLFRRDHRQAGWLADIGLFHHWYLFHACQALERLDGSQVRIST